MLYTAPVVQRVSAIILTLFALAALILSLLTAGRIAVGDATLDIHFRPLPRSVQIISLIVLLCVGVFWLWRIKKQER